MRRDPTSAVYFTNRAAARTKLMDFVAAQEDCEKARRRRGACARGGGASTREDAPSSRPAPHALLTFALARANPQAIKLDPMYARAYIRRGAIQLLSKELHRAMDSYQAALKLEPGNTEAAEGLKRTFERINADSGGKNDAERSARAMADPEVQAILSDPMVSQAISDMQSDPNAMRAVMRDPAMAAKIRRLIAAGVISVSGGGGGRV